VFQGNNSFDKLGENEKLNVSDEENSLLDFNSLEKTSLPTAVKIEKIEVLIPAWCNLHDKDMWWNDVYDPTWIKYKNRRKKIFAVRIMLVFIKEIALTIKIQTTCHEFPAPCKFSWSIYYKEKGLSIINDVANSRQIRH